LVAVIDVKILIEWWQFHICKDESRECLFGHFIGKTSFRKKLSLCEVTRARQATHNNNEIQLAQEIITILQTILN
jgi:hypothetical protein